MRAPTQQVSKKLLSAHKQRSLRMITQFKQSLLDSAASGPAGAAEGSAKSENIAHARQFHQSMMVGLIEACKGIIELYTASDATLPTSPAHTSRHTAATTTAASTSADGATDEAQTAEHAARAAAAQEASAGYKALECMIAAVMAEYTKTILQAFQAFLKRCVSTVGYLVTASAVMVCIHRYGGYPAEWP
jgi:hypothetical protein